MLNWSEIFALPSKRLLRQFAAAWLIFFLTWAVHREFVRSNHAAAVWFCVAAIPGVVGIIWPLSVRWLYVVAMVLAFPIGWVISFIALAVMYYCLLTPVAFLFRIMGRDALRLRAKKDSTSYWVARGPEAKPDRYLRQY